MANEPARTGIISTPRRLVTVWGGGAVAATGATTLGAGSLGTPSARPAAFTITRLPPSCPVPNRRPSMGCWCALSITRARTASNQRSAVT